MWTTALDSWISPLFAIEKISPAAYMGRNIQVYINLEENADQMVQYIIQEKPALFLRPNPSLVWCQQNEWNYTKDVKVLCN